MYNPPKSKFIRIFDDATELHENKEFNKAKIKYLQALEIKPDNSLILWKLGDICIALNEFDHAAVYYSRLERLSPGNTDIINNFAFCLIKINAHEAAEKVLLSALEINSNDLSTYLNLIVLHCSKFQYEIALQYAKKALLIAPSSAIVHNNVGAVLQKLGHDQLAAYEFETASLIDPKYFDPQINLAGLKSKNRRFEEAIQHYEVLLNRIDLDDESAIKIKQSLAANYLSIGNLELGWRYYELGFHPLIEFEMARSPNRVFSVPRWEGGPLGDRTILVWGEQGIGDELLFMSCLQDLCKLTENIIVECQSRIVNEIARSFPKIKVRASSFNSDVGFTSKFQDYDLQIPMGSLPLIFRKELKDFHNGGPYLIVHKYKAEIFEKRIADIDKNKLRIGVCWRSGFQNAEREYFYSKLSDWGPIFSNKNLLFINLQYGECEAELICAEKEFNIEIIRWPDLNLKDDFESTFALISRLDAVVTIGSAVVAMSGAVGVKTFLMAPSLDWPNLGTNDYPWFPNVEFITAAQSGEIVSVSRCLPIVADRLIHDIL